MKKYLIFFVAMTLVLCMTLPLVSCMANIPSETTSTSESAETDVTVTNELNKDQSDTSEPSDVGLDKESESTQHDKTTDEIKFTEPTSVESDTEEIESTDSESVGSVTDESEYTEAVIVTTETETEDNYTHETDTYVPIGELPTGEGYTWKDAVTHISGNWNPHTYQTEGDSYPLSYITAGLYAYFYNDEVINKSASGLDPFKGYVLQPEMAVDMPVDITEIVKSERPEFGIPAGAKKGYAYKIALNRNATWENGRKINADTYVYSMSQLLDPALNNYKAPEYFWIANAEEYLRQGSVKYVKSTVADNYTIADLQKGEDEIYINPLTGNKIYIAIDINIDYFSGNSSLAQYVNTYGKEYFSMTYWKALNEAKNADGVVALTDETYAMILDVITGNPNWGEDESYLNNYFVEGIEFDSNYAFSNVGLFKASEYEIVIVLDKPLDYFDLIGKLTENWIVYKPYYEACKVEKDGRLSSTYGTSVNTTMSYGPYKLTAYQKGGYLGFARNEGWYGYTDGKHIYVDFKDGKTYDMYQTTSIICRQANESEARNMFFRGETMSYVLASDDLEKYKDSDRAYFTPSDAVYFLVLNGHKDKIKERETADSFDPVNYDIETLTLESFRKALTLTYDRDEFASAVSPSRVGSYGLIGSAYVYDPETGAKYRDTDEAKKVLCEFYGVDISDFDSLDAAVDSITGCAPDMAKALFADAFRDAIEAGYITDSDGDGISDQTVKLEFAHYAGSGIYQKVFNHLNEKLTDMTVGTPFEGKVEICETTYLGCVQYDMIGPRLHDVALGGWGGDLLNPYALTENYTDPQRQYDAKWFDSSAVSLTLNIEGNEITMSLREWSQALNGTTVEIGGGCEIFSYNFGDADAEIKLQILAAIEREILSNYNYIPMLQDGSYTLLSDQVDYASSEYNPVVGRGGLAYVRYNYNDSEWAEYVKISKAE